MKTDWSVLDRLYATICARRSNDPEKSYVAKITASGRKKLAQKVGEEGVETALAAMSDNQGELVSESADLLFHLFVLWADAGIKPDHVLAELTKREGVSGLVEKAGRKS